jgi:PAS domain S-box-containing protein
MNLKFLKKAGKWFLSYNALFVLLGIISILMSWKFYNKQKEQFREMNARELVAMADLKIQQIEEWQRERLSDANFIFRNSRIINCFKNIAFRTASKEDTVYSTDWMQAMYKNGHYKSISFIDSSGSIILTEPYAAVIHLSDIETELNKSRILNSVIFSDLNLGPKNEILLHVIVPLKYVKENNSLFVGWVILCIDPFRDFYPLIQKWQFSSKTAEALIVRMEGDSVLFLNELRHLNNTALKLKFPLSQKNLPAVRALLGDEQVFEGTDYRGSKVLAATRKIPDTNWSMVVKIDRKEYLANYHQMLRYFIIFVVLVISSFSAWYAFYILSKRARRREAEIQMKYEQELLATRYDYFSRYANDAIILINNNLNIIEVNDKATELYGYPHQEITSLHVGQLYHPDERRNLKIKFRKLSLAGNDKYEAVHLRKDGSSFYAQVSASYIIYKNEHYYQMICSDISQRIETENKLKYINRLYAFLSQLNMAIVKNADAEKLLKEVTEIAINYGKFKMAWVGIIDSEGNVVPLYHAGDKKQYLKHIHITIHDEPSGQGPTGSAIRTNKVTVCNNIENNSRMTPWQKIARESTFRSSAAIPLRQRQQVMGALNLYAGEENFFTEQEIMLLEEVADDIAFALDSYDSNLRLKESEERFRSFFEQSAEGIMLIDENGYIIEWNNAMEKITGWKKEQIVGKFFIDVQLLMLTDPRRDKFDADLIKQQIAGVFKTGSSSFFEKPSDVSVKTAQGEIRQVMQVLFPIKTHTGYRIGVMISDITERKKAEEALLRERSLLRTIIDNIPAGVYIKDAEMRKVIVNKADLEVIGLPEEEVIGKTDMELFPLESAEKFMADDRKVIEKGEPVINKEELAINIHGRPYWLLTSKIPLHDSTGKVTGLVGIWSNITEQKKSQGEIIRLTNRLNLLTLIIKELSSARTLEHVISIIKKSARNLLGADGFTFILKENNQCHYIEEESIKPLWKGQKFPINGCLSGWVMLNRQITIIDDVASNPKTPADVYAHTFVKSLVITPVNMQDPVAALEFYWGRKYKPAEQEIELISTLADATARAIENVKLYNELEKMVDERTKELTDLYNNAPCGYHSLDSNGMYVRVNETELRWLGYTNEELVGQKKFDDLLTEDSKRLFALNFPVFKKRGWVKDLEYDMVRKDGSILPVILSATAIMDENGNYLVSRSTIIDNSERKQAEETMFQTQVKLENLNQELEAFVYTVSHDLRAPLRAIDGFVRILVEDYQHLLDAEGKRICNIINDNTAKMAQLIDGLLALSRFGRTAINFTTVDMNELARSVFNEIMETNQDRNINFKAGKLLPAYCDEVLIRQVWFNLLSNAVKFTRKKENPHIEIISKQTDTENIYSVIDNGSGFNPEYANKLFKVFQRLHKEEEYEGTGVGLAIVQRIVSRHGGRVWAESEVNQGSTFYFTIPKKIINL